MLSVFFVFWFEEICGTRIFLFFQIFHSNKLCSNLIQISKKKNEMKEFRSIKTRWIIRNEMEYLTMLTNETKIIYILEHFCDTIYVYYVNVICRKTFSNCCLCLQGKTQMSLAEKKCFSFQIFFFVLLLSQPTIPFSWCFFLNIFCLNNFGWYFIFFHIFFSSWSKQRKLFKKIEWF